MLHGIDKNFNRQALPLFISIKCMLYQFTFNMTDQFCYNSQTYNLVTDNVYKTTYIENQSPTYDFKTESKKPKPYKTSQNSHQTTEDLHMTSKQTSENQKPYVLHPCIGSNSLQIHQSCQNLSDFFYLFIHETKSLNIAVIRYVCIYI